jgi:hypothetical protein
MAACKRQQYAFNILEAVRFQRTRRVHRCNTYRFDWVTGYQQRVVGTDTYLRQTSNRGTHPAIKDSRRLASFISSDSFILGQANFAK